MIIMIGTDLWRLFVQDDCSSSIDLDGLGGGKSGNGHADQRERNGRPPVLNSHRVRAELIGPPYAIQDMIFNQFPCAGSQSFSLHFHPYRRSPYFYGLEQYKKP